MKENTIAPLGILAALADEIRDLIAALEPGAQVHRIGLRDFHQGILHGQPCVIALTRVGKAAAAATTATLLQRFGVGRVIFTGVAGGLHRDVRVGDIVIGSQALQHDMDARPLFGRHEIPLLGRERFDTDAALSALLLDSARDFAEKGGLPAASATPRVHHGLIATGDIFVNDNDLAHTLRERLPDALCLEMEGAAMAQVCHEFGVPFAVMRVISDSADHTAKTDFTDFLVNLARLYTAGILKPLLQSGALRDA